MVKLFIDLLSYLRECAPLFVSLAVLTLFFVLLAKSIHKHPGWYYTLFAIPFVLVALPTVGRLFGIEIAGFVRVPFLGEIIRDYIHMGTFGHPLLIIIMYIGALNVRHTPVKRLMSIRKEMSIIVGFAVFAHSLIRVMGSVPGAFRFFADNEGYLASTRVVSTVGAGFSSFSFLLGVIMLLIFIPLWVTSFDAVRKRMGNARWKKWQKWSYVLYATLFIHAMGIQIGGILNPRGGHAAAKPAVEVTANVEERGEGRGQRGSENARPANANSNRQTSQAAKPANNGRTPTKGFADFKPSVQTKQYIHLVSLLLIYGSYLYLRLRKMRKGAFRDGRKPLAGRSRY